MFNKEVCTGKMLLKFEEYFLWFILTLLLRNEWVQEKESHKKGSCKF